MKRTNIYLEPRQLGLLRGMAELRGKPVAALIREAIDEWLASNGAREVPDEEWRHRLGELLERRRRIAEQHGWTEEEVERDVWDAVREVRSERAAGRR